MEIKELAKMQAEGKYPLCPRCGMATMKPDLHTNALSRVADIYICDACGTREAVEAWLSVTMPVSEWDAMTR